MVLMYHRVDVASPPDHMRSVHRFQTVIPADDRIYVASGGQVYAFAF